MNFAAYMKWAAKLGLPGGLERSWGPLVERPEKTTLSGSGGLGMRERPRAQEGGPAETRTEKHVARRKFQNSINLHRHEAKLT